MSGGRFQYKQHQVHDIANDIEEMVINNDNTETIRYGDSVGYGYPPEIIARFREAAHTLRKAAVMAQRVDWLVSCDDGPDSFIRRWDEELAELNGIPKATLPKCMVCGSADHTSILCPQRLGVLK